MGEQFNILLNQMLVFFTLIIIGFVAQKIKLLANETIDGLSKLVVKLILPLMVFTTVVNGATISGIAQKMPFFLFSFLMIFILVGIGILSSKLMRLPKPTNYINTAIIGFPNTGFMGYPLLLAMFPETGPLAVAVYVIVDQLTFWTFMPVLTQKEITLKSINIMNMVKNPPFVALILGIICISFKLHPSGVAWDTMTAVGGTCKYFALIYIGADIGRRGFKTLVEKPKVFLTIPIKLIIAPVVVFFLFKFIGALSSEDLMMITILAMLPSMVVLCMLAAENDSDADYATAGLIVTTLCSMATMPLVMKFLMAFL